MRRPDLPVGGWLAVGLGAAAALLVGLSAAALAGLRGIDAELARQTDVLQPHLGAAMELQMAVLRLGIAARAQALAPTPARVEALHAAEEAADRARSTLDVLPNDVEGAALYARIPSLVASFRGRAHELAVAAPAAVSGAESRLREVQEALVPLLDRHVALQQRRLADSSAAVVRRRQRANQLVQAGVAFALAILGAVGVLVSRAVRRPAHELAARMRRVGGGDYAAAAALPNRDGRGPPRNELAELAEAFGSMARALDERERRIALQTDELQSRNEELQAQNEEILSQRSELALRNEELVRIQAALRDADRRKDEFLAVLSHELRNPLAPIVSGLAILAQAPPGSESARRAREIVSRQVRQLVRLVDDLLDVTRIARGKAELRRARLDLAATVRDVAEDHRALLERAGVRLELAVPPDPIPAFADAERLSQVVANLLQNAVKFTPSGGTVRVECSADGSSATLRVQDDGEGIPPELRERLFVPFVQADASLARPRGGLGLGLALVKGIVELHGGSVAVASEGPGRGAEFTVRLPLEPVPGASAAPAAR